MYDPCPIDSNGFCPRHATWHNAYQTQLCLDTTERGERVRLALDKKYAEEIAAFQLDPTHLPTQKKKTGCPSCQQAAERVSRGILPHKTFNMPNKQGGCTRCGRGKPTS